MVILKKYKGMRTRSGQDFSIEMLPESISLSDIAWSLAGLPRFLAHAESFYSVAEHSIRCAEYAIRNGKPGLAKACLLHDASEAYLGDIPSPWKTMLPDYVALEAKVSSAIFRKFGVDDNADVMRAVKQIDHAILKMESVDLFGEIWSEGLPQKMTPEIEFLDRREAATQFLWRCDAYGIKR